MSPRPHRTFHTFVYVFRQSAPRHLVDRSDPYCGEELGDLYGHTGRFARWKEIGLYGKIAVMKLYAYLMQVKTLILKHKLRTSLQFNMNAFLKQFLVFYGHSLPSKIWLGLALPFLYWLHSVATAWANRKCCLCVGNVLVIGNGSLHSNLVKSMNDSANTCHRSLVGWCILWWCGLPIQKDEEVLQLQLAVHTVCVVGGLECRILALLLYVLKQLILDECDKMLIVH